MTTFIPAIITKEITPSLFTYVEKDIGKYFPEWINFSRDPLFIKTSEIYEQKYKNDYGIDVKIIGCYDDVISVLDILNTYPPKRKGKIEEYEYVSLTDEKCKKSNVPTIDRIIDGKHLIICMDGKLYSGSGIFIFAVDSDNKNTKIILFRSSDTNYYEDLGGKIDKMNDMTDILFKNAVKEAHEESAKLLNILHKNYHYIDIISENSKIYYRSFVYIIKVNDLNNLKKMYSKNLLSVYKTMTDCKNLKDYLETNNLEIFDYETFIDNIPDADLCCMTNKVFQTNDGKMVNVRKRTMQLVSAIHKNSILDKLLNEKKVNNITIENGELFNIINI